jgi:hypothetical protein
MGPNISKNFTYRELGCKCGTGCAYANGQNIDPNLIIKLQKIRNDYAYPMTVNSGIRCPKWNAEVGGRPGSHHLPAQGCCAVDIHMTDRRGRAILVRRGLELGLSIGVYKVFIHLDNRLNQIIWGA